MEVFDAVDIRKIVSVMGRSDHSISLPAARHDVGRIRRPRKRWKAPAYSSSDPWFAVWPTSYGYGRGISESGDKVLGHDGSNNYWYARAIVYVDKGYALLAVTNAAGLGGANPAMEAVNDTTIMLESYHSGCPDNGGSRGFSTSQGR